MKKNRVVIDTNALISFVTDRNLEQQNRIKIILEKAAALEIQVLCPQNVLTEFVYVLENVYGVSKTTIKTMLSDFSVMPGVKIVHELDLETLFAYWPEKIPDYGDAIVASICEADGAAQIVTFDRKFKNALKKLSIPSLYEMINAENQKKLNRKGQRTGRK